MSLKDYKMQPDEGLFEKIEQRVRRRRMMRRTLSLAGVGVVAVATLWMVLTPKPTPTDDRAMLTQPVPKPAAVATPQQAPAEVVTEPAAAPAEAPEVQTKPQHTPATTQTEVAALRPTMPMLAVPERPALPAKPKVVVPELQVQSEKPVNEKKEVCPTVAATPVVESRTDVATAPSATKGGDPSQVPVHYDNVVWAPNIIVPSGDVEENRTFKVKLTSAVTSFRIEIYNRGGRLVFVSTDPSFAWDGTFNGTAMPQGAYVWVAKFRDSDNRPHQEKGTVTIVR